MSFPVYIELFGLRLHPHLLLEVIAYTIGSQIYVRTQSRWQYRRLSTTKNLWIIAGCIVGALIGSKVLSWIDAPNLYWSHRDEFVFLLGGKTIVGGLLGGWIGVELAKLKLGIRHATGDAFVFPLIAGMFVGRIGCFLSGLEDSTYGTATTLPWGIDFGDGIARHPTQLYEIAFLIAIGIVLRIRMRRPYVNGYLFRAFVASYLLFRFAIDFIKPGEHIYLGLNGIQLACVVGAAVCIVSMRRMRTPVSAPHTSKQWQIDPTSSTS